MFPAETQLKRLIKTCGDPYYWSASRRELRRLFAAHPGGTPEDILALTKQYRGQGWYKRLSAYQIDGEFTALIGWAVALRPRVVLEIGTAQGATLLAWCRIATDWVISVDLPNGIHGGGYAPQKQRLYRELVYGRRADVRVELLQADSHQQETRLRVERRLEGRSIDILFIDGDHRYEGVKRDFELWSPLVSPGGHVVFHDIVPHRTIPSCQVDQLWRELKPQYSHVEIVAPTDEGWGGIGILQIPA